MNKHTPHCWEHQGICIDTHTHTFVYSLQWQCHTDVNQTSAGWRGSSGRWKLVFNVCVLLCFEVEEKKRGNQVIKKVQRWRRLPPGSTVITDFRWCASTLNMLQIFKQYFFILKSVSYETPKVMDEQKVTTLGRVRKKYFTKLFCFFITFDYELTNQLISE